ncbi:MAG: hypothetical protein U1E73_02040 [Planctomycetota bacterium]
MGIPSTPWQLGCSVAAIVTTALLVGASGSPDVSPEEARAGMRQRTDSPNGLCAATVDFEAYRGAGGASLMDWAPAPLGETADPRTRGDLPALPVLTIAYGRNAGEMVAPEFQSLAAASLSDATPAFTRATERDAIELAQVGRVDLAIVGDALSVRDLDSGLRQVRIGVELFAVAVADAFPLQSIARSQMRLVLTGAVRDWRQLGYDRGAIEVVVPAQASLAERAARTLIRGDTFTTTAVRVGSERHVADQLLRNPDAIAVVRVGRSLPAGVRLLEIDWTPPSLQAFDYGNYPYGVPLHVVTAGPPDRLAAQFLAFATGEDAREFLGRTLLTR